jgi:hypothetical protein
MLVLLLSFIEERDLLWLQPRMKIRGETVRVDVPADANRQFTVFPRIFIRGCLHTFASFLAYGFLAAAAMGLGLMIQRHDDRHDNRPPTLERLDPDAVAVMLAGQLPAYADYLHRLEIGSRIGNFHTFGERQRFRVGMTVFALGRFLDRHPPLRLNWLLIDAAGREIERLPRRLDPSVTHAWIGFRLTDALPPGEYEIVLQIEGVDVARKTFLLVQ